jgi:signal transduction histidine kinase
LLLAFLSVWAIQRSRVSAALDLAKLQMEFVASVSHELRTPLAVISSAADNIADGLVSGKEEQKKYGIALQNQSRQMAELVNQILLFAATKDRKVPYASRTIRVSDLVDSAVSNTSDVARNAGFTVQVDLDPDLPPLVGDLSLLSQCLQNLIGNALKYSGESRWIGIRAMVEPPKANNGSRQVLISVQDRGIGIDSSELADIFQPFYRSAAVTAEQIHGTGLGLSLSRNIAEGMGGRLEVSSQLGIGSTFILRVPAFEDSVDRSSAHGLAAKGVAAQHE